MKSKQLIILTGVLAVAGGITWYTLHKRSSAIGDKPAALGSYIFDKFASENLGSFTVTDNKESVTVEYKDGKWIVPSRDNFPANVTTINDLRDKVSQLTVLEVQKVGANDLGRCGLREPGTDIPEGEGGKLVSMKDLSGNEMANFVAGKTLEPKMSSDFTSGMPPRPQYIKVKGVENVYKSKEALDSLNTAPKTWLDKEKFFKVDKLKSVAVTGPSPEETWKVFREASGGELKWDEPKAGEEFDAAKASGAGNLYSWASFEDVAPAADKEKSGLDKPTHTAVIDTFDGLTYTVKVGNKVANDPKDTSTSGAENYYMSFTVDGKLDETVPPYTAPEPKAPAGDAKPEDKTKYETDKKTWEDGKKTAEETFKKDLQTKKDKLAAEQAFKDRIFVVTKYTVQEITKKRSEFMKEKAAPATPPATPGAPDVGSAVPKVNPGGGTSVTTPPIEVKTNKSGKIEATTPPIEVNLEELKKAEAQKEQEKKAGPKKPAAKKPVKK